MVSATDNGPVAALERPLPLFGVQRISTDLNASRLTMLKRIEHLSAVTFRTSLEGRSTRSVGRESFGVKRSVRVQAEQAKFEEEQLLDLVRGGWNTCEPIGREFAFEPGKLTDEQRKAFAHILASRDLVMDVSGIAGAGKSHLLKQVQEAAVSVGQSVAILSNRRQRKEPTQNRIPGADVSRIPTQAGKRGPACD